MVTNSTHMEAEMTSGDLGEAKRVTVSVCASDDDTHIEIEVRHNGVWLVDEPSFTLRIAASELDRAMCAAMIIAKGRVDE